MLPVEVTADWIYVRTPYDRNEYVRNVLNGVWSDSKRMYRFPRNWHVCRELLQEFPQLQYNSVFMRAYEKLARARITFSQFKAQEDAAGDPRLRPYQRVDVAYLRKLPSGGGNFNEQRTGKTPETVILLRDLGMEARDNIVVCPASLIVNWQRAFREWAPEFRTFPVVGDLKRRKQIYQEYRDCKDRKVLIISKDTWKLDVDYWLTHQFDAAVVDEAHFMRALAGSKRKHTQQAKAVCAIQAARRYALTGTPTVRHAADVYGILHWLYPKKFPSFWQFADRYFDRYMTWGGGWEYGEVKPHREQELQELIGFISVQRKRKDVMRWLPEKIRVPIYVEMHPKQRELYDQMLYQFMVEDGDVTIDTANVLAQLMRLRQLCLDPRLLGIDCPSAKTQALLEWLQDNQEPVVIMSMFTSYLKLIKPEIEKLGRKVVMVHGEMSPHEKDRAIQEFQRGKADVILCNIISAGVGVTLDRAEVILFTDHAWNPADNEQAEDRITPTTPERAHSHSIITIACEDSVDESINHLLEAKKSITDVINEGGYKAIQKLIRGEF